MPTAAGGLFRGFKMEKSLDNYGSYLKEIAVYALGDTWNGSKFSGSFGPLEDYKFVDYWTLRKRSLRLFKENMYAKGIIRRLIWNEIHTGLIPAATPVSTIIWPNMQDEEREETATLYSERFATEFNLYAETPTVFDFGKKMTFGAFQARVRFESLICGDGIIISRINQKTSLPSWQWVNGDNIRTPDGYTPRDGNWIKDGVEFDKYGNKVAFHVRNEVNGNTWFERVPTRGEKSGRLISWMVYGSETLLDDVRGEPFLADTLYMLKDLDRYRDAETRAAVVNAMLAFFVEHAAGNIKSVRPSDGLARLRPNAQDALPKNYEEEGPRQEIRIMEPGTIYDNLSPGDKINSFQTNRPNVNYATFEGAILSALAWTHGIPPEILMLRFGSNYSASRQANNEFEVYLTRQVKKNADTFCQNIYSAFITQCIFTGQLKAPGFVVAYNDDSKWRIVSAWLSCAWIGLNRPAVDRQKEVNASQTALDNGLTTFDIEARRTCGLSFTQVMQTQKAEREMMKRFKFTPHVDEDNNGLPVGSKANEDDTGNNIDDETGGENNA